MTSEPAHQPEEVSNELPESFKNQDPFGRDSDLILERLEEVSGADPVMAEGLRQCREVRSRLIKVLDAVGRTPKPMRQIREKLNAAEKFRAITTNAKVLEQLVEEWKEYFTPDQLEPIVENMGLHPHIMLMLNTKTHEALDDQIHALEGMIRARFCHVIFDGFFKEATERLLAYFPEDFMPIFRRETIESLQEESASFPQLKTIFERFSRLRDQVKSISREVRALDGHRKELREILARQMQAPLKKSRRKARDIWVRKLVTAEENVVPDQISITDYELKGFDMNWVIDPSSLQGEQKRLHMLDIVQAATINACGKLLLTLEMQLEEQVAGVDLDDRAECPDAEQN